VESVRVDLAISHHNLNFLGQFKIAHASNPHFVAESPKPTPNERTQIEPMVRHLFRQK
jgi:hypothetical protein